MAATLLCGHKAQSTQMYDEYWALLLDVVH
jgi:hypothetical protein